MCTLLKRIMRLSLRQNKSDLGNFFFLNVPCFFTRYIYKGSGLVFLKISLMANARLLSQPQQIERKPNFVQRGTSVDIAKFKQPDFGENSTWLKAPFNGFIPPPNPRL